MKSLFYKWTELCRGSRWLAGLTSANAAVWIILTVLSLIGKVAHADLDIAPWLSVPGYFPAFLTRPWTLLTYMVVQTDGLHMLFNVLWLYWFGLILLITLQDRHLAALYIGGGICGGLLFLAGSALGWGGGWLCGSSASVLAVMAAAAIRLPDHEVNLFLIGAVRLKWVALVCAVLTFIGGGGSQAAHIGGLAFGITFGVFLRRGVDITRRMPRFTRNEKSAPRRSAERMLSAIEKQRRDHDRLDLLLDKIRTSGYGSLSRRERSELQNLSSRIKND